MNKRTILIVSLVLIVGLFIYASPWKTEKQRDSALRVAVILPLTGEAAKYGEDALNGMLLAEEEIKASGREAPELIVGDSKGEPGTAVTVYQHTKAVSDIQACITILSGVSKAVAPIAARDGVFHFATVAAAPNIFGQEDPAFRWYYSGDLVAAKLSQLILDKGDVSRVTIFAENIEYSSAASSRLVKLLTQSDIEVSSEQYDGKSVSARDLVVKNLQANPDIVVLLGSGGRAASNLIVALREQGYLGLILSDDSVSFPEVLDAAGAAAEDIVFVASEFDGKNESDPFVKAYRKKFKKDPSDISAFAYDMIKLLAQYSGLSTGHEIAQGIASVRDYPSVMGKVTAVAEEKDISVPLKARRVVVLSGEPQFEDIDRLP